MKRRAGTQGRGYSARGERGASDVEGGAAALSSAAWPSAALDGGSPSEQLRDGDVKLWLARELHDTVLQALTVMVVEIERCRRQQPGQERITHHLERLEELGREVIGNLRETLQELRGEDRPSQDLLPALRQSLARFERQTGIKTRLFAASDWPRDVSGPVGANLYRIVQEALNNVRAHSRATEVTVELSTRRGQATLAVMDDGTGIDHGWLGGEKPAGFGLLGMKERALLIGGVLRLESSPQSGTRVSLTFPVSGER